MPNSHSTDPPRYHGPFRLAAAAALACIMLASTAVWGANPPNPCLDYAPCTANNGAYGCGYGSVCVGAAWASGHCRYPSANLTCGEKCYLVDSTTPGANFFLNQRTCTEPMGCRVNTGGAFATCGHFLPEADGLDLASPGCPCEIGQTVDQCRAESTCQSQVCSFTGTAAAPWGADCLTNADCASNNCTQSICYGKSENVTCSTTLQCAKGLTCVSTKCKPILQPYELCNGTKTGWSCPAGYFCDSSITQACMPEFTHKAGESCDYTRRCLPGLTCIASVCSANTTCGILTGSTTCAYGQNCGCGYDPDEAVFEPGCKGDTITTACATAYVDFFSCLEKYATRGINTAIEEPAVTRPIPTQCKTQMRNFLCKTECAGPNSAYRNDPNRDTLEPYTYQDYNVIDCGLLEVVVQESTHNYGCEHAYCPGQFGALYTEPTVPSGITTISVDQDTLGFSLAATGLGLLVAGFIGFALFSNGACSGGGKSGGRGR